MAKILTQIGIESGDFVEAFHVTQSIDAFTGVEDYDITVSGSFTLVNGTQGVNKVAISDTNGKISFIDQSSLTPSASPLLHTYYAFVDLINGNDSTATLGDEAKPFITIAAAQIALITFGVSESQPGCIYLRSGTYTSTVTLKTNIITYCEPGVVFTSGGFIDDINTIKAVVLGYATFIQDAILYSGTFATEVYIQAHSLIKTSGYSTRGIISIPTNGWTNITVELDKCVLGCTAYDITTRGLTNFNFTCKTQVEFYYNINNVTAVGAQSSIGKVVMTAPSWLFKAGGGGTKYAFRIGGTAAGFQWIHNGDIINESGNTSSVLIFVLLGYNDTLTINGNVDMGVCIGSSVSNSSSTKIIFNSPIFKGSNTLMTASQYIQVLFNKCRIIKQSGTAVPAFQVSGTGQLNMVGCQFIQEDIGSINMINVTSNTAIVNMLRTNAQSLGSANYLINSNATSAVLGIKNCISNINISNVLLHKYSTNNLEVEPLLTLPNF